MEWNGTRLIKCVHNYILGNQCLNTVPLWIKCEHSYMNYMYLEPISYEKHLKTSKRPWNIWQLNKITYTISVLELIMKWSRSVWREQEYMYFKNCICNDKTQISNLSLYQLFIIFILLPEYINKITVYVLRLKIRRNSFTGGKKINRRL